MADVDKVWEGRRRAAALGAALLLNLALVGAFEHWARHGIQMELVALAAFSGPLLLARILGSRDGAPGARLWVALELLVAAGAWLYPVPTAIVRLAGVLALVEALGLVPPSKRASNDAGRARLLGIAASLAALAFLAWEARGGDVPGLERLACFVPVALEASSPGGDRSASALVRRLAAVGLACGLRAAGSELVLPWVLAGGASLVRGPAGLPIRLLAERIAAAALRGPGAAPLGLLAALGAIALAPLPRCAMVTSVAWVACAWVLALFFLKRAAASLPRVVVAGSVLLPLVLVNAFARIVLEDELARSEDGARKLYAWAFDRNSDRAFLGTTLCFLPHHHLNYALNPRFAYGGTLQFDEQFLIRRTERLRPRGEVRWRALALGGSTTFGERLEREEETWVHVLEQRLRAAHGGGVDVVNGGVGGYTLVENLVHYTTLLTHLEPDVVIVYAGINDVHPRLHDPAMTLDYSSYWKPWRAEETLLPEPPRLLGSSSTYRLYYLLRYVEGARLGGIQGAASSPASGEPAANLAHNDATVFARDLENLARFVLAQGRRVAIVPQYFSPRNEGDALFARALAEHNAVCEQVATKLHVPFARRIVEPGLFADDDTFDNCHFDARGSEKMAAAIERFLLESGLAPQK